jgi:Phytanoyl-CoA dioxygenase (PhyH)
MALTEMVPHPWRRRLAPNDAPAEFEIRMGCEMKSTGPETADHQMRPLDDSSPAEHYRRFGWWVSDAILPLDLVREVKDLCAKLDSAPRDGLLPDALADFLAWDGASSRPSRLNQYIALQYQAVYDLVMTPRVHEIAAELSGADSLRIFNTALINKAPGAESRFATVGIHCDAAYWRTCSSKEMLTAWVPLQDTTLEMGPIRYYSGSHLWPQGQAEVTALRQARNFTARDEDKARATLDQMIGGTAPTTGAIRAGQVTFHHCLLLHGSGTNASTEVRDGISIHLQPGHNRYQRQSPEDEYVHDSYVRLRDGVPDYADEALCPVTWPLPARHVPQKSAA